MLNAHVFVLGFAFDRVECSAVIDFIVASSFVCAELSLLQLFLHVEMLGAVVV